MKLHPFKASKDSKNKKMVGQSFGYPKTKPIQRSVGTSECSNTGRERKRRNISSSSFLLNVLDRQLCCFKNTTAENEEGDIDDIASHISDRLNSSKVAYGRWQKIRRAVMVMQAVSRSDHPFFYLLYLHPGYSYSAGHLFSNCLSTSSV